MIRFSRLTACLVLLAILQVSSGQAADIRLIQLERFDNLNNGSIDVDSGVGHNLGSDGDVVCNFALNGPIEQGDLARLKAVHERARQTNPNDTPRICLNSPGGSYVEGLLISSYLIEESVGTAVPAGAKCYSSCAIIFMGGSYPWKGQINRYLHVHGDVGFHAPYIPDRNSKQKQTVDEAEVRTAFSDGIRAMRALMELGVGNAVKRITPELMQELIAKGPDEVFSIDTIGKAIRFRVHLYGIEKMPSLGDDTFCNVCVNMNYGALESYGRQATNDLCTSPGQTTETAFPGGVRYTSEVAPRGGACMVDVLRKDRQVQRWSFVDDERNAFGDGLELAYWFLYPPNLLLTALAEPPERTAEAPKPSEGVEDLARRLVAFVVDDYLGNGRPDHENDAAIYGATVTYYGNGRISRDRVMRDKAAYYRKWPSRTFELIEDSMRFDKVADGSLDVTFRYRFAVSNGQRSSRGTGATTLGVMLDSGRFVIVRENGQVEK